MVVNGEDMAAQGRTIAQLLADYGLEKDRVVIEVDGQIIPRDEFLTFQLQEEAKVEVVSFVGGG